MLKLLSVLLVVVDL